jgi:hypothetical protein
VIKSDGNQVLEPTMVLKSVTAVFISVDARLDPYGST